MTTSSPDRHPQRPRQRGQATVETVGIIVAIALLLAATGAWLSGSVSLPKPPDLIGAITRVFGGGREEPAGPRPGLDVPGAGGYVRLDHGFITPETHPPIGAFAAGVGGAGLAVLTATRDGVVAGGRLAGAYLELPAACAREFNAGFWERVEQRARALARDPRKLLRDLGEIGRDPVAALRQVFPDPMGVVREVRRALSMSWRERALYLSRVSGRTAADFAIDQLTQGATRIVGRVVTRGRPRGPAPKAPRGEAARGLRVGDSAALR
jgi:hypothetical protein